MIVIGMKLYKLPIDASNFYKDSMRNYKGSMSLFRTLVWTNEITIFVTTSIEEKLNIARLVLIIESIS
jgi:hypothetical protein